jgi:hypothetical protein
MNKKFRKYLTQHRNKFYAQHKEVVWNIPKKVVGVCEPHLSGIITFSVSCLISEKIKGRYTEAK